MLCSKCGYNGGNAPLNHVIKDLPRVTTPHRSRRFLHHLNLNLSNPERPRFFRMSFSIVLRLLKALHKTQRLARYDICILSWHCFSVAFYYDGKIGSYSWCEPTQGFLADRRSKPSISHRTVRVAKHNLNRILPSIWHGTLSVRRLRL